jgi:RES domain-containing protein
VTSDPLRTTSWVGPALRHLSANSKRNVLDFEYAGTGAVNRWNIPGAPTLYLAGDRGVLVAEWGRHLDPRFPLDLIQSTFEQRDVFQLQVKLDRIVDLRDLAIATSLGLQETQSFLDLNRTRMAALTVRHSTNAQGMLVPSVAFLDDMSRWNLVIFLEKVPASTSSWITDVKPVGPLRWQ